MNKKLICFIVAICLIPINSFAVKDSSGNMFYDNLAIRKSSITENSKNISEIIIQEFFVEKPTAENMKNKIIFPHKRIYKSPILTIREDQLPTIKDMCLDIDASTCEEVDFKSQTCISPCFSGMSPLAYYSPLKILYFTVASTNLGTGGGDYFLYSVDINTKKISYIKVVGNPLEGSISPDGKYLTYSGFNGITIYNTQTKEEIHLSEKSNWNWDNGPIHLLGNIKWLNNTQLKYRDGLRHHKFQHSYDEMKEITYDISTKKVLATRIMSKTEYDSKPFVDER